MPIAIVALLAYMAGCVFTAVSLEAYRNARMAAERPVHQVFQGRDGDETMAWCAALWPLFLLGLLVHTQLYLRLYRRLLHRYRVGQTKR